MMEYSKLPFCSCLPGPAGAIVLLPMLVLLLLFNITKWASPNQKNKILASNSGTIIR